MVHSVPKRRHPSKRKGEPSVPLAHFKPDCFPADISGYGPKAGGKERPENPGPRGL